MANDPKDSILSFWLIFFAACVSAAFWQAHEFDVVSKLQGPNRRAQFAVEGPALEPPPTYMDIGLYNYPKQAGMVLGITSKQLIILQSNDGIYAVNRDGERVWTFADTHSESRGFQEGSGTVRGDEIFAICRKGYVHVLSGAGEEKLNAFVGTGVKPRVLLANGSLLLEEMPRNRVVTLLIMKPSGAISSKEELGSIIDFTFYRGGGAKGPYYYVTAAQPGVVNGKALLTAIGGDGKKLWQQKLAGSPTPSYVSGDGVFYHCCDPWFSAIGADGKRLWQTAFPEPQMSWSCAAYILGEWNEEIFFQGCTKLLALSKKDGRVRTVPLPFKKAPYSVMPGRLLPDGTLAMMGDHLYRMDANGKVLWRFAPDLRGDQFRAELRAWALAKNGDVFALSNLPEVYCITAEGKKRWVYRKGYIGGNLRVMADVPGLLIVESGSGVGTFALKFPMHDEHEGPAR